MENKETYTVIHNVEDMYDILQDKIYKLLKAEKIARRDKLIAEHGFGWRKHEQPFTEAEMQAFELQAKDLIIKEMH